MLSARLLQNHLEGFSKKKKTYHLEGFSTFYDSNDSLGKADTQLRLRGFKWSLGIEDLQNLDLMSQTEKSNKKNNSYN